MRSLLLLLSLLYGGLALADDIQLSNGDWPPYLGEHLPHQGVASRIINDAFASQGIDVQWKFYPWARALHLAERGELAGSAVWLRSKEREDQFFISEPVIDSRYVLFYRKDHPVDWRNVDDLAGLRIGATNGYDYGAAFQQAEAEGRLQISRQTSDELGLRQLLAGRIDALPLDQVVAYALLNQHFSAAERAQIGFHPQPLRSDSLHLLLSRQVAGNAERMARFNQGLAQLRSSGRVAQYLREVEQSLSLAP
ncbi:transporter substrate-binding domain-containing protein [Pseudomonas sp. UL073]|uniref:Transporter substrate-binding domain-containing protein n=1 Tax=Zestomonas insulae TaxID=2809017 RepID=A0ABS2IBJ4_9GAMM|nr:transporter substrate-binding domain-containing protein [Pseudomonas insulae]MBM7060400.1 transporter substrate-binding domain-containing protein [Pseudomonas insulae]